MDAAAAADNAASHVNAHGDNPLIALHFILSYHRTLLDYQFIMLPATACMKCRPIKQCKR